MKKSSIVNTKTRILPPYTQRKHLVNDNEGILKEMRKKDTLDLEILVTAQSKLHNNLRGRENFLEAIKQGLEEKEIKSNIGAKFVKTLFGRKTDADLAKEVLGNLSEDQKKSLKECLKTQSSTTTVITPTSNKKAASNKVR